MHVDFSTTLHDYAAHRPRFPAELFDRLQRFGIGAAGQTVLDVGAGTGLLAAGLHRAGCRVVAVDLSTVLLARCGANGRVAGRAEGLPFADGCFDAVTAAQCWHWFDRAAAPREARRVLRPGGWLAVVYQMHLPLPGNVAEASERLILKHRPGWRHANSAGISGQVLRDVQVSGFVDIESFSFDREFTFASDQWRGCVRTFSAVTASLPPAAVEAFDREHEQLLRQWPPTLQVPHRIFAAVARKPAADV